MKKGYSLIEILVVMGISAMLLGVVIVGQREFSRRKVVDNGASVIISHLRQAQNNSDSGVKPEDARCQGDFRLEGYEVIFNNGGYVVNAVCINSTGVTNNITDETYAYPEGIVVLSYPSNPILFKSISRGTNLSSVQNIDICAFNFGQRISINPKGGIFNTETPCS